jgi:hypothetical protein
VSEVQFASDKDCVFKLRQDDGNEADDGQIYRTQVQETLEALSIRSEHSVHAASHRQRGTRMRFAIDLSPTFDRGADIYASTDRQCATEAR